MPTSAGTSDARVRFLRAFGCPVLEDRTQGVHGYLGAVANEARTTSLIICSKHNEVRVQSTVVKCDCKASGYSQMLDEE